MTKKSAKALKTIGSKPSKPHPITTRPDRDRRVRQNARIARVLGVLNLIQSRGRWTRKTIAEELECSERTVGRDLEVLEFAGVPYYDDSTDHTIRVRPDFLSMYFKWQKVWEQAAMLSTGMGDRRRRIQPDQLLKMRIPLPPLSEQRRLVEYLEAISTRIRKASQLVQETSDGLEELCRSVLNDATRDVTQLTPMQELVHRREPDVEVRASDIYHFAGVYCFGKGVFVGQKKSGMEFQYSRLTQLRTNDFVYPKLMAWEGALGVVPPECNGLVVSTEFPVFEINQNKVLPEILDVLFKTPSIWPELSGASTGTNVRRRRLNPTDFLKYRIRLPERATQFKVRELRSHIHKIRNQRTTTLQELEAMLPAIMYQTFNGQSEGNIR